MEDSSIAKDQKAQFTLEKLIKDKSGTQVPKVKTLSFQELSKELSEESQYFSHIQFLSHLLKKSKDIDDFVIGIMKLSEIKSFSKLNLLIHEKGNTNSLNYSYTKENKEISFLSVEDFSKLFNGIKKSKDRSFGEHNLKGIKFDILGTFLAHEYTLKHHSVILILGNEDFLPPSNSSKLFFKAFAPLLQSFIGPFVERQSTPKKDHTLNEVLQHSCYPFKYCVNEQVVFETEKKIRNEAVRINISANSYLLIDIDNSSLIDQTDILHQERVKVLGDLFNTLKHELSNPLFGLQLSTDLLLMDEVNNEQKEFLTQINISIKRCQDIIENFKELYNNDLSYQRVDLIELLNEVFVLTKSKSRNLRKEIVISTDELEQESIYIESNRTWLAQIFFNLIINSAEACQNTKEACLTVDFNLKSQMLQINFKDNGPGFKQVDSKQVFTPFYTTKPEGTGLGLAICHNLSRKLGGNLSLHQTGKGASFDLVLPYERPCN